MRASSLILTITFTIACKDKQAAPEALPPAAPAAPAVVPGDAAARPALAPDHPAEATAPPQPAGEPLSIEDAAKVIPKLEGKEILPLRQTSDKRQVHSTWCMDGAGADEVARSVGRQMADAKYTGLAIRGDANKAGVQGERDGFRMSMIVSASSAANCPAPSHYFASATIFRQ